MTIKQNQSPPIVETWDYSKIIHSWDIMQRQPIVGIIFVNCSKINRCTSFKKNTEYFSSKVACTLKNNAHSVFTPFSIQTLIELTLNPKSIYTYISDSISWQLIMPCHCIKKRIWRIPEQMWRRKEEAFLQLSDVWPAKIIW